MYVRSVKTLVFFFNVFSNSIVDIIAIFYIATKNACFIKILKSFHIILFYDILYWFRGHKIFIKLLETKYELHFYINCMNVSSRRSPTNPDQKRHNHDHVNPRTLGGCSQELKFSESLSHVPNVDI